MERSDSGREYKEGNSFEEVLYQQNVSKAESPSKVGKACRVHRLCIRLGLIQIDHIFSPFGNNRRTNP